MGPYDNEAGVYLFDEAFFSEAIWLQTAEGSLVIIPASTAEIEGGEPELVDALNVACQKAGDLASLDVAQLCEEHDLTVIPQPLRRFDEGAGYYSV